MLKRLFTSNTRIKLLNVFILNPNEEFFIRELTRKLEEQINSIRRELTNLKRLGFLKCKTKNRKKYYYVDKNFVFYEELKSMVLKSTTSTDLIARDIGQFGVVKVLILSGQFVGLENNLIDILIVGEIDREKMTEYLNNILKTKRPVRFAILSEEDYKYRQSCNDKFIKEITENPLNKVLIKKI